MAKILVPFTVRELQHVEDLIYLDELNYKEQFPNHPLPKLLVDCRTQSKEPSALPALRHARKPKSGLISIRRRRRRPPAPGSR